LTCPEALDVLILETSLDDWIPETWPIVSPRLYWKQGAAWASFFGRRLGGKKGPARAWVG